MSTPRLREIEREIAPLEAAHSDALRLDPALFARIDAVHEARHDSGLDDEAVRLVERYHLDFVLAGAQLDDAGRARLTELNQELSTLSTTFGQNLQLASEAAAVRVADAAELDGLDAEEIAAAAAAAADRGVDGYLIALLLPDRAAGARQAAQPRPAPPGVRGVDRPRLLRRARQPAGGGRASPGSGPSGPGCSGSTPTPTSCWPTPPRAPPRPSTRCWRSMVPASVANADAEAAVLAEAAGRDGVEVAPWDWAFYSEQVRAERYAVDTTALRPYFELDRVLVDGVFHAAELLYGYRFAPRPDLDGYHPDVRVWEVSDADGAAVGLYLGDFFAREGKRGGAWMSSFVRQSALLDTRPVVVNNLNVTPGAGRSADAPDARRGQHVVPRVRARPARAELGGHLPAVLRHQRAARLRRVPQPGQRDVGAVAAGPRQLRPPRRDRGTAAGLRRRGDRRRPAVGRGLRDPRVPRGDAARPGLAPHHPGRRGR